MHGPPKNRNYGLCSMYCPAERFVAALADWTGFEIKVSIAYSAD
jgi:hypothetical protein